MMVKELEFPYKPRPWQAIAVGDLANFVDSPTKYAILVAGCGEGKEVVIATAALRWTLKGGKAVWLTAKGATGEWNKRKELEACLSVNPMPVKVVFLRAKEDACPYRIEWAEERGVKPPPAIEFCNVAKAKCPFYKNFIEFNDTRHDDTLLDDTRLDTRCSAIKDLTPRDGIKCNRIDEKSVPSGVCPYYFLREAAKKANIIIADYNYVISPIIRAVMLRAHPNFIDGKTLLLFDEAHLMADRARGAIRGRLSTRTVDKAIDEVRGKFLARKPELRKAYNVDEASVKALQYIRSKIRHVVDRKSMEIKREYELTKEEKAKIAYYDFMDERVENSIELLKHRGEHIAKFKFENDIGVLSWTSKVASFLERFKALKQRRWLLTTCGLTKPKGGRKKHPYVGFSLLDPWVSVSKALKLCGKAIFYSGTLHDENFAAIFRLREYKPLKGYPPSFPPENRIDIFVSEGKITRDYYETEAGAEKICNGIVKWYEMVKNGRCYMVVTYQLYRRLFPTLKKMGLKPKMIPLKTPKNARKEEIEASFADPTVTVSLSPYSWASSSCDIKDCVSVLTVGIPVARLTLERRETIEYFRRLLKEEKPEKAAWVRIAIIPALENAVQASERARRFTEKDRISHIWMDERYVRKKGYHGHIQTLTAAKNVKFAQSLSEMQTILQEWLKKEKQN
jgi:Rad3-related DNA helicase